MTRIALYQSNTGIDPSDNTTRLIDAVAKAAEGGAKMLFTPEMSGMLDRNRQRASGHVVTEKESAVLAAVAGAAHAHGIWVALGSLAIKREDAESRWANRSFLISPDGVIAARYDKVHMFDVDLNGGADASESWRESNGFAPGDRVVTAATPIGRLGLAICYDMRFPALWAALGDAHCDAIACPAAFTRPTGAAHWHVLLRARAIEASAYVIAAAQCGEHEDGRKTYGHSLVVDPWGEVVLDMGGSDVGIGFADLDAERIATVRAQLPSLANRRTITK